MKFAFKNNAGGYEEVDALGSFMGNELNPDTVFLPKSEAIKLARSVLSFYGAGLEEPKREPQIGQVWATPDGLRFIVIDEDERSIRMLWPNGTTGTWAKGEIKNKFVFVAESWAEEKPC